MEVIDSHEPSDQVLASQEKLAFAYFRHLPKTSSPKARRGLYHFWSDESQQDHGNNPKQVKGDCYDGAWLCSVECLRWWQQWGGYSRASQWEARKCANCGGYLHENALSNRGFNDWADDPNTTYCIHCAALVVGAFGAQWRAPGELAGGDPREWTPVEGAGPADLLLAYTEAAFWCMVWEGRVAKLGDADTYDGSNSSQAEEATEKRLRVVTSAFDEGDLRKGANLLLPIGAPSWAAYEDEPQRLLAFREDNCRDVANCWSRLLQYRLGQLPKELQDTIRASEPQRQALREQLRADHLGEQELLAGQAKKQESIEQERLADRGRRVQQHQEQQRIAWSQLDELYGQASGGASSMNKGNGPDQW